MPAKRYYVGFWNESPPTPDELRQSETYDGHPVTFADGTTWIVPAVQMFPRRCRLNAETGDYEWEVDAAFQAFWKRAMQFSDQLFRTEAEADRIQLDADYPRYIVQSLRFNYRLTAEVVDQLGLISSANVQSAILATLDFPYIVETEAAQKKTPANPAGTPAG